MIGKVQHRAPSFCGVWFSPLLDFVQGFYRCICFWGFFSLNPKFNSPEANILIHSSPAFQFESYHASPAFLDFVQGL